MAKRWTTIKRLEAEGWDHNVVADDVNTGEQVWRHDYMTMSSGAPRSWHCALLVVVSTHDGGGWALNEWTWREAMRMSRATKRILSVRFVQERFDVLLTAVQLGYVLEDKTIVKAKTPSAYYKLAARIT